MLPGKLPPDLLARMLSGIPARDPRVILGASPGEDAAIIDIGDRYLVAKTDPVTFATDLIGWYMVQVNANDLAAMGATPRWLLATLLLPERASPDQAQAIFAQILDACAELDITLIGGHTEITYDLPRPIAVGAMLGEAAKDRVVLTSGAAPGDAIILTQGIAIEGSSILAREAADALTTAGISPDLIRRAQDMLFTPGISVAKAAAIACDIGVNSMHDPTEGGLATALRELATAANIGVAIRAESIPVLPECRAICQALALDPLGLIASGALLATLPQDSAANLISALRQAGIPAAQIGSATHPADGLTLTRGNARHPLPEFARDELARYFA